MAVVGIGVDVVDVARFEESITRTPRLLDRLFTDAERDLPIASLAARFAAKEAVTKALGGAAGRGWQDVEIRSDAAGAPSVWVRDSDWTWHVSLSHDAGMAIAMVVAER